MTNDKLISEAMRLLGSRTSKAKAAAARANGRGGGRPGGLKRWHVFTTAGRKTGWAETAAAARANAERRGFEVLRVAAAPDPTVNR